MMMYIFKYSDGTIYLKYFQTKELADEFAHLEGDHLISYELVND